VTPAQRVLRARIAANTRWSREDGVAGTEAARAAARAKLMVRFEDEVDPERRLPPEERAKRAERARRAHFQRLALASAKKRSRAS
jgi:hypothetical protein